MFNPDLLMLNSEVELILKWSENCILTEKATKEEKAATLNPAQDRVPAVNVPSDFKFSISSSSYFTDTIPKSTLQRSKTRISIDFKWSKYRFQMINQTATNNLNFLIDPTFNNVNRLFQMKKKEGLFQSITHQVLK